MTDILTERSWQSRQFTNRATHSFLKPKRKWSTAPHQFKVYPKMFDRSAVVVAKFFPNLLKNVTENTCDSSCVLIAHGCVETDFHSVGWEGNKRRSQPHELPNFCIIRNLLLRH